MSYFREAYTNLKFTVAENGSNGLRRAQLGAVYAIGAYFALPRNEPGLVVMPTGSGKSAVMIMSAFLLRANRVLILTPSRLVRAQIAEEASALGVLKHAGVLPELFEAPKVREVKERVTTPEAWEEVLKADIVVATPQCVSPGIATVAKAPDGSFDLVLMDEAHHSEAPRWADILDSFKDSRRLLFTATPFRRDKRELRARIIFSYPLRLAHEDKIFGDIEFAPVLPSAGESHDVALARAAEALLGVDQKAGLDHRLMVRTDTKSRADELKAIYSDNTKLNLAVVHSDHSLKTVRDILNRLRNGELDGIICVAMMGEGFDFPRLKIAAIHAPHKSLAVTLQFIGRFARTGSTAKLGKARFLAVPQDIQAETDELYRESAAWQEIVANLSAARIEKEVRAKEIALSFESRLTGSGEDEDVVLTDLKPYFHVKIYRLPAAPDLESVPDFGEGVEVRANQISQEHSSCAFLLKQITQPRWTELQQFARVEYDLVIVYYHENSNLLFINSSRRTIQFYKLLEEHYGQGNAKLIPGPRINRVLADLKNAEFFSVGMKNTVQTSNTESYQIKAGPSAQNAISVSDGLLYQRGHVFGKGITADGKSITIGYSSSSKVWSNAAARVAELIEWCQSLAGKLAGRGPVLTGTRLDALAIGEEIETLPAGVIGAVWPAEAYREFPRIAIIRDDRAIAEGDLLDAEIEVVRANCTEHSWEVRIQHSALSEPARLRFEIKDGDSLFERIDEGTDSLEVCRDHENVALLDYLRHYPIAFFLNDFSRLDGVTLNRNLQDVVIPEDQLASLDWRGENVSIETEINVAGLNVRNPASVQDLVGKTLVASEAGIVFYDHGTGEMADFLSFSERSGTLEISLYHCKGSGGADPGDRVDDAYEVCGQVVKCLIWLKSKAILRQRVLEREASRAESTFLKGTRNDVLRVLADDNATKISYRIFLVQPGISVSDISNKIKHILGAASDYVQRSTGAIMHLLGSP